MHDAHPSIHAQLIQATQFALHQQWHAAHQIAQSHQHPSAYWLHAVLHKIEGDKVNSHYWYAKTNQHQYNDYCDVIAELNAILTTLET